MILKRMIPFNFQKSDPHGLYWIGGQCTIGHGPDGWRIFSPLEPQKNCQGRSTFPKMQKKLLSGTYGFGEFHQNHLNSSFEENQGSFTLGRWIKVDYFMISPFHVSNSRERNFCPQYVWKVSICRNAKLQEKFYLLKELAIIVAFLSGSNIAQGCNPGFSRDI